MLSIYRATAIAAPKLGGQSRLTILVANKMMTHQNFASIPYSAGAMTIRKWYPLHRRSAYMSTTADDGSKSSSHSSDTTIMKRPFTILGVQQIAIGHDDRAALNTLWYTIFGLKPSVQNIKMENENVCEDIVRVGGTNEATSIEIDLMTPLDINKSPKVHIPPLNHIGLWVDDIHTAVEWMTQQGVRFTPGGIRKGAAGYDVTFIHPKGNDSSPIGGNGILIELVQAPDHIKDMLSQQQPK
jgi:lactoylglutathione lyase